MKQICHLWLWSLSSWTHATSTTRRITRPGLPGVMMRSFLCLSLQLSRQQSVPQTPPRWFLHVSHLWICSCALWPSAVYFYHHFSCQEKVKAFCFCLILPEVTAAKSASPIFHFVTKLLLLLLIHHQFYTRCRTPPRAKDENSSSCLHLQVSMSPPAGSEQYSCSFCLYCACCFLFVFNMNVWTTFRDSPSSNCWNIPVKAKVMNQPTRHL